jgi:hypothetical protein
MRQKFLTIVFRLVSKVSITFWYEFSAYRAKSINQSKVNGVGHFDKVFSENNIFLIVTHINFECEIIQRSLIEGILISRRSEFAWISACFQKLWVASAEHIIDREKIFITEVSDKINVKMNINTNLKISKTVEAKHS